MSTLNGGPGNIVTNGLVLYLDAGNSSSYPRTGTVWSDLTNNRNNGTLTNGPTFNSANAGSIVFDGANDFASVSNSTSLQFADIFTINVWIYPTDLSNRFGVFSTRILNKAGSWQIEVGTASAVVGGQGRVAISGVAAWIFESFDAVVSINRWSNVCFVKPNNATQGGNLYVNGVEVPAQQTTAYTILNNSDTKVIGQGTSGGQPFPGRISALSIYNVPLSYPQILQNYNSTKARFGL